MARLYTEGFENGTLQNDPNNLVGGAAGVGSGGRKGAYCLTSSTYPGNNRAYQSPQLTSNPTEIWVRTAFQPANGLMTILSLGNPAADEIRVQAVVGQPVKVLTDTTTRITGLTTLQGGNWYLLELHYKLPSTPGGSDGRLDLKIEGTSEGFWIGNTAPLGSNAITRAYWWGNPLGLQWINYDDLAINDNTGTADNTWCGDGYVLALRPNAQGSSNQWLRNDTNLAAVNNYDRVSEVPPDNASTYVYSQTVGNKDFYNLTDLVGLLPADAIRRLWISTYASEAVAGGDAFQVGLYINSTEYWSANQILSTLWQAFQGSVYSTNPNTAAAWTQADVNALQVGIKVV